MLSMKMESQPFHSANGNGDLSVSLFLRPLFDSSGRKDFEVMSERLTMIWCCGKHLSLLMSACGHKKRMSLLRKHIRHNTRHKFPKFEFIPTASPFFRDRLQSPQSSELLLLINMQFSLSGRLGFMAWKKEADINLYISSKLTLALLPTRFARQLNHPCIPCWLSCYHCDHVVLSTSRLPCSSLKTYMYLNAPHPLVHLFHCARSLA